MRSVISPNSAILEDCSRRLENVIGLENRKLIGGVRLYPPVDDRSKKPGSKTPMNLPSFSLNACPAAFDGTLSVTVGGTVGVASST